MMRMKGSNDLSEERVKEAEERIPRIKISESGEGRI